MKKYMFLFAAFSALLILASCSKNNNADKGTARLQVYLTDDPASYDAVNINVQDIMINVTDSADNGWQSLSNVKRGSYNLLDLVNDKDTILADAVIPSGKIHQIRLVLGDGNTIVENGTTYPLTTPSAQQSGLKLNIQQDVTEGVLYKLVLDFDAGKSIVKTGNGKYILKPVIRTVLESVGGSIKGVVTPFYFSSQVLAIQGPDTVASTYIGNNGGYLIKGLLPGSYDVHVIPEDVTFKKGLRTGVIVNTGAVTLVDTIKLVK
jgi:major membrane immunogen (membrane-anchored lipoprotein)